MATGSRSQDLSQSYSECHLSTSIIKERKIKFESFWRAKCRHLRKSGKNENLIL